MLDTLTAAQAWRSDMTGYAPAQVVPEALIVRTTTTVGTVTGDAPAMRVPWVNDDDAGFVSEGSLIPEGDPDLAETVIYTGKIAKLLRISAEQYYRDETASLLADAVTRTVTRAADIAFLTQDEPVGATTPPAGLLHAQGATTAENLTGNLDTLHDLLAVLENALAHPSHIILDPAGWAALGKMKTGEDRNDSLLGSGTTAGEKTLLGLPVIVTNTMPTATGLIIDKSDVLSVLGKVEVATSEHAYFTSQGVAVRCTWRIGAKPMHPERLGIFTIA